MNLSPSRRGRSRGLLTATIALVQLISGAYGVGACGFEPSAAPMHFSPNKITLDELADQPDVRAKIAASLDAMFGTPEAPRYPSFKPLEVETNAVGGLDHPELPLQGGGTGEIEEPQLKAIHADDRRAFAHDLALVEAQRYDEIAPRRSAPDLERRLREIVAQNERAQEAALVGKEVRALLEQWYPSLRDSAELYRQECLHCHGVEGGGDGPTAAFLDPKPRDFRKGVFKFTAVKDQARARREDLLRTLDQGLPGSAMPSFRRFSLAERNGLADYVRFLAIRGEVELRLVGDFKEEGELAPQAEYKEFLDVWKKWRAAHEHLVVYDGDVPAPTPERVARGDALFHDATKGNCSSCHGDRGHGDGPASFKMGLDGKRVPAYLDAWDRPIVPRDLTLGLLRGGARPIDVYRRIYAGINGTPMPALGEAKDAHGAPLLSADDLWCLVHYVRSLSQRPEGT